MTSFNKNNNKIYGYIIILISIFILILVTRIQISDAQLKLDEISINSNIENDSRNKLTKLNEIEKKLKDADTTKVSPYLMEIKEDEILEYIYSKIESDNLNYDDWAAVVRNISITKGDINEIGFNEATLNLSLRLPSEQRLMDILDFFTWEESKYKFFINSFVYPKISSWSSFNVNIPLKIFYK